MTHLLIVAHGSRRAASNQEIHQLTERLAAQTSDFASIRCAFLELAEPSIPDGLRRLIADGAETIVVMPYFLSAGRHVSEDIPAEIQIVSQAFPQVKIVQANYLGAAPGVADLLLQQASRASC